MSDYALSGGPLFSRKVKKKRKLINVLPGVTIAELFSSTSTKSKTLRVFSINSDRRYTIHRRPSDGPLWTLVRDDNDDCSVHDMIYFGMTLGCLMAHADVCVCLWVCVYCTLLVCVQFSIRKPPKDRPYSFRWSDPRLTRNRASRATDVRCVSEKQRKRIELNDGRPRWTRRTLYHLFFTARIKTFVESGDRRLLRGNSAPSDRALVTNESLWNFTAFRFGHESVVNRKWNTRAIGRRRDEI